MKTMDNQKWLMNKIHGYYNSKYRPGLAQYEMAAQIQFRYLLDHYGFLLTKIETRNLANYGYHKFTLTRVINDTKGAYLYSSHLTELFDTGAKSNLGMPPFYYYSVEYTNQTDKLLIIKAKYTL